MSEKNINLNISVYFMFSLYFDLTYTNCCPTLCDAADSHLVLVQFTVLVLFLSLLLKCDDHKTYEDVHHEKGDDDDVDDEEDGNLHAVVVNGAEVLPVGVDGLVQ